jgi:hypothetical protein
MLKRKINITLFQYQFIHAGASETDKDEITFLLIPIKNDHLVSVCEYGSCLLRFIIEDDSFLGYRTFYLLKSQRRFRDAHFPDDGCSTHL